MAQQGIVGTAQERADMEEQIPASEFREFMREMREFKEEANKKFDTLIEAGNDRDKQIVDILREMGGIRKRLD